MNIMLVTYGPTYYDTIFIHVMCLGYWQADPHLILNFVLAEMSYLFDVVTMVTHNPGHSHF